MEQHKLCHLLFGDDRNYDYLAILPTGGGKTLPIFVRALYLQKQWPSYFASSQTPIPLSKRKPFLIFVVPLRALNVTLFNAATAFNIKTAQFTTDWLYSSSSFDSRSGFRTFDTLPLFSLLFVSLELTKDDMFKNVLDAFVDNNLVDRFVIDECHLAVTHGPFREAFQDLLAIRGTCNPPRRSEVHTTAKEFKLYFPLLLLSATVPSDMELNLTKRMATKFVCIRAKTTRPEVAYRILLADWSTWNLTSTFTADNLRTYSLHPHKSHSVLLALVKVFNNTVELLEDGDNLEDKDVNHSYPSGNILYADYDVRDASNLFISSSKSSSKSSRPTFHTTRCQHEHLKVIIFVNYAGDFLTSLKESIEKTIAGVKCGVLHAKVSLFTT